VTSLLYTQCSSASTAALAPPAQHALDKASPRRIIPISLLPCHSHPVPALTQRREARPVAERSQSYSARGMNALGKVRPGTMVPLRVEPAFDVSNPKRTLSWRWTESTDQVCNPVRTALQRAGHRRQSAVYRCTRRPLLSRTAPHRTYHCNTSWDPPHVHGPGEGMSAGTDISC
jgi:hypothetical protein